MSDRWSERLSEYIDGELSAGERRELEAHLAECDECSRIAEDLRRLVGVAASLEDRAPATDLWDGIVERIGVEGGSGRSTEVVELEQRRSRPSWSARRFTLSLPQVAAAAVMLMVVSGGAAWLASDAGEGSDPRTEAATPATGASGSVLVSGEVSTGYDAAIAELERLIADNREELNPQTVRIIEENLRVIDQAIAQARRALEHDPASVYLNEHLASTMRQKLEFLRHAASMARAAS